MPSYVPNTEEQQRKMLKKSGFADFDGLFADIPENVKLRRRLNLPEAMPEISLMPHMLKTAAKNYNTDEYTCFLGAGAYDHYIPAAVKHIISRQEFETAYTPYQPEISQGTLEAIFEFQSMICSLTGLDVANASLYDGATALAEAAAAACRATKRHKVLAAGALNPQYLEVVKTYGHFHGFDVVTAGLEGGLSAEGLAQNTSDDLAAVLLQSPNFFGNIEDVGAAAELAHKNGALLVVSCDPISLAILKAPGELGADIAVGEGQCLGSPLSFGGPYLGFFAAKESLIRKIPGRIVGLTKDQNGKPGFVLTLQAREQHIRREKATSNICSNQALNALAATVYLSLLGKQGLKEVASLCTQKAHYAAARLAETKAFAPAFSAPFFKEFAVKYKGDVEALNKKLLKDKIIGGFDAGSVSGNLKGIWIIAVTEKRTREDIDNLAERAAETL